jgi:Fe-S oxidoreductase
VPDQLDCQMPALCYGDIETARAGLRRNVAGLAEAVRDGYTIVSAEPTATLMLREEMLDVIDSAEARLVAENTRDLCEFLLDLHEHRKLSTDFAPIQMNLGYHMPCHLGALKIGRPGLELLRLIPGIKVKGIQAGCCGLAGTFGFQKKNFDVAMAAGSRLSEALREDSIEAGTTECATCKMQMELGGGKPVWHPVRLLSRAYSQASDR